MHVPKAESTRQKSRISKLKYPDQFFDGTPDTGNGKLTS